MNRSRSADRLVAALALGATACVFGHSIARPNDHTVVENLGANRYVYRLTQLVPAAARGPAAPAVAIPPAGAREIGLIEAVVDYSGFGPDGLRTRESAFYPRLADLAGEMGGTHFLILRSTREVRPALGDWITSVTVDVLAAPP